MATLLNRLGDMAKNAADKTGDIIEIGKLNSKINSEQQTITSLKEKIGTYYFNHSDASTELPAEVRELCQKIQESLDAIAMLQQSINTLKGEGSPAAVGAKDKCITCGAANAPGTKFCGSCGAKLS